MSTSSTLRSTATVAADVWMRPSSRRVSGRAGPLTMHARFELELGERPAPADLRPPISLYPALGAFARGHHLGFPALLGRIASYMRKRSPANSEASSPGAGADLEDDVALSPSRPSGGSASLSCCSSAARLCSSCGFLGGGHGAASRHRSPESANSASQTVDLGRRTLRYFSPSERGELGAIRRESLT